MAGPARRARWATRRSCRWRWCTTSSRSGRSGNCRSSGGRGVRCAGGGYCEDDNARQFGETLDHGYSPFQAIERDRRAAGVRVQTVYFGSHTKPLLLTAAIDTAVMSEQDPTAPDADALVAGRNRNPGRPTSGRGWPHVVRSPRCCARTRRPLVGRPGLRLRPATRASRREPWGPVRSSPRCRSRQSAAVAWCGRRSTRFAQRHRPARRSRPWLCRDSRSDQILRWRHELWRACSLGAFFPDDLLDIGHDDAHSNDNH